jgi:hypothetical protein
VSAAQSGAGLAALLASLVDALIPGDGGRWPSASQVGVHGVLPGRLIEVRGLDAVDALAAAVLSCGGALADGSAAERARVVARFEAEHPALFAVARTAVYLAYYESPAVIAVIRSLGHRYQAMAHAAGYPLPPFDPERDRPRHGRGRWIATDEVRRVDLSGLGFIGRAAGRDHG